jgi:hypothetical protein
MTKLSTAGAPFGVGRSTDELDLVESVIDEGLKVLLGGNISIQSKTGPNANN